MRRTTRLVTAVLLTLTASPLLGIAPASAATSSEPSSAGAYFYEGGIDKPAAAPAAPPNVTGDGDFVATGHLAVAVTSPGRTTKMSFLQFDLPEVPFDAVVTSAVVSVPLAADGNGDPRQNRSVSPAAAKVRACPADATGFNGEDGASFAEAPKVLCDAFAVTAKESADKTAYEFDIAPLVNEWLKGENNGLALVPAVDSSAFQVVFKPFDEATLAAEFTAPVEAPDTAPAPVSPPQVTLPDSSSGGSGDSGSAPIDTSSGFDSGSAPVEAPAFGSGTVDAPVLGEAPVAPEEVPVAEEPAVAGPTQPVALRGTEMPLTPSLTFWVGSLLTAALLALVSLVVGDTRVPVTAGAAPTRLSRALQNGGAGSALRNHRPAAA